MCFNESVPVHRAYAYVTLISGDQSPEPGRTLIDCHSLFNGRNITTDYEDMWFASFEAGNEFVHIAVELKEPREITSKYEYLHSIYRI